MEDLTAAGETAVATASEPERGEAGDRVAREIADIARDWLDDQKAVERRRRDASLARDPVLRR